MSIKNIGRSILLLLILASFTPANANTSSNAGNEVVIEAPLGGVVLSGEAKSDGLDSKWGRDKEGFPYYEEVGVSSYASEELMRSLIDSKEINSVLIDDSRNIMLFSTTAGVFVKMVYHSSDVEFMQFLLDKGISIRYHTFLDAPEEAKPEVLQAAEKSDGKNYYMLLRLLPFLIMISGIVIIFELRQRNKRKPNSDGKTVAFQTREGPGGFIPTVTFEDVAGCEEAIEYLNEIVEF